MYHLFILSFLYLDRGAKLQLDNITLFRERFPEGKFRGSVRHWQPVFTK